MDETKTNKRVVRCLVCKGAISPGAGVWWPRFKRFLCQEHRGIIANWTPRTYTAPAITLETDLETTAGSPRGEPDGLMEELKP